MHSKYPLKAPKPCVMDLARGLGLYAPEPRDLAVAPPQRFTLLTAFCIEWQKRGPPSNDVALFAMVEEAFCMAQVMRHAVLLETPDYMRSTAIPKLSKKREFVIALLQHIVMSMERGIESVHEIMARERADLGDELTKESKLDKQLMNLGSTTDLDSATDCVEGIARSLAIRAQLPIEYMKQTIEAIVSAFRDALDQLATPQTLSQDGGDEEEEGNGDNDDEEMVDNSDEEDDEDMVDAESDEEEV